MYSVFLSVLNYCILNSTSCHVGCNNTCKTAGQSSEAERQKHGSEFTCNGHWTPDTNHALDSKDGWSYVNRKQGDAQFFSVKVHPGIKYYSDL